MLWFFDRDEESLRLETRYDNQSSEFVVTVNQAGAQREERFADIEQFQSWLELFEFELRLRSWTSRTGPVVLPYGWPDKPLK
jgi:hypothetical protein